jgi:hypothetical protein
MIGIGRDGVAEQGLAEILPEIPVESIRPGFEIQNNGDARTEQSAQRVKVKACARTIDRKMVYFPCPPICEHS